MKIHDMTISEFVCNIMERRLTNKSEIYAYIKYKTGNFDSVQSILFKKDMKRHYIEFLADKETEYESKNLKEITPLEEWLKNSFDHYSFSQVMNLFRDERRKIDNNFELINNWEKQAKETQNKEINTEKIFTQRACKAFDLAIKKGFMEETDNGYKWLFKKVSLGYFLRMVYDPKGKKFEHTIHYKQLEKLFGVERLDRHIERAFNVNKPQKWRTEIDELFK